VPTSSTHDHRERLSIVAFAGTGLISVVCAAFAAGRLIGRMLL